MYDLWSHVCLIFCYCVVLCQQALLFFHKKSIFDYGNLDQTIAHNNLIVLITLYPYKKRQKTYIQPPPLTHVLTRKREFKGPFFLYLSIPYAQTSMQLSIQLQLLRWHNKTFTKSNKEERQLQKLGWYNNGIYNIEILVRHTLQYYAVLTFTFTANQ